VDYKECEPVGGWSGVEDESVLNLIIHETEGAHWTYEKEEKN